MEFPPDWEVFPMEEFETASPRIAGDYTVELMAQLRPNGRIQDHWRLSLGGSKSLDIDVPLASIIPSPNLNTWRLKCQFWPRDVTIRRNMVTSGWQDVYNMLAARNAGVVDEEDHEVLTEEVIGLLDALPASTQRSASICWAVVIGEDGRMRLDLQSLPASSEFLNGKPALKG